jgi:iron(III)-enterobactin esterase
LATNPQWFSIARKAMIVFLGVSLVTGCNLPQFASSVTPNNGGTATPAATRVLPSPVLTNFTSTPDPLRYSPTPPTVTPSAAPVATLPPPVTIEKISVPSRFMNGMERIVSVYLPGNYREDANRRYKVLYAFDGQSLPSIAFEVYLNSLVSSKQMQPIIVVAIDSLDGDLRQQELGTGPTLNVFGWGTLSDAFNKFLVNELVPEINKKYRTLTAAADTGVMGWSLGGLAAFYLGWQYSSTFGIVGAFSPSLWWRTDSQPGFELQARVIQQLVRNTGKRPGLRMWFEAGTNEDPLTDIDKNGVVDVIQNVQDLMSLLRQKGYQDGAELDYVQVAGGQHDITTWAKVLPDFLHWAFPVVED